MPTDIKISRNRCCVYTHSHDNKVMYVGSGYSHRPFDFQFRDELWNEFFSSKDFVEVSIVEWFSDEKSAEKFQRQLIKKFQPPLNPIFDEPSSLKTKIGPKKRLISVSFRAGELEQIQRYLDNFSEVTGFKVTRNEFIRRSALASMGYFELRSRGWNPDFEEVFKGTTV